MEGLGSVGCPHPVNLNHNETVFGHRLRRMIRTKRLGNKGTVRSSIDLFDHRVGAIRIKVSRLVNHSMNVGHSISSLGHKSLWYLPSRFEQTL